MSDMAFRNKVVTLNNKPVFALRMAIGERVYTFSLSLNTHEKAESK